MNKIVSLNSDYYRYERNKYLLYMGYSINYSIFFLKQKKYSENLKYRIIYLNLIKK